jgi:hypothetical protein
VVAVSLAKDCDFQGHQSDSVHLLVFLLSFECDGDTVCKL